MSKVPEIYILHGWAIDPQNQLKWQPFIDELKSKKLKPHFLKLPGLSTSIKKAWQIDDYLDWLSAQIPTNKKSILIGHSFGGQLSVLFAKSFPERVGGLVLIDSSGIRDQSLFAKIKRLLFYFVAKVGRVFTGSIFLKKWLYKIARVSDYNQANPVMKKTMANVIKVEVREVLPKIKVPTLIIWGQDDKITPVWMANYFNQYLENSRLSLIPKARHAPQFTHTKQTAQKVAEFIKTL